MEKQPKQKLSMVSPLEETLTIAQKIHELDRPSASVSLRISSRVLDMIFIYLLVNAADKVFQAISSYSTSFFFLGYMEILIRLLLLFTYGVLVTAEWGGSLGQILLGLKVIDSNTGEKLSVSRSFFRILWLGATNFLSLLVVLMRKDKRALHDIVCNTTVKRVRGRP